MEYQYIVNPQTNRRCRVDTVLGKRIIKNYKKTLNKTVGGSSTMPSTNCPDLDSIELGTDDYSKALDCHRVEREARYAVEDAASAAKLKKDMEEINAENVRAAGLQSSCDTEFWMKALDDMTALAGVKEGELATCKADLKSLKQQQLSQAAPMSGPGAYDDDEYDEDMDKFIAASQRPGDSLRGQSLGGKRRTNNKKKSIRKQNGGARTLQDQYDAEIKEFGRKLNPAERKRWIASGCYTMPNRGKGWPGSCEWDN